MNSYLINNTVVFPSFSPSRLYFCTPSPGGEARRGADLKEERESKRERGMNTEEWLFSFAIC